VIVLAQEEAGSLGHNYIGSEHILLGRCERRRDSRPARLRYLGVTLEAVREAGRAHRQPGPEGRRRPPSAFHAASEKDHGASLREAHSMGHSYIGTEHLLLAIVREHEGVAMRVLLALTPTPRRSHLVIRNALRPSGRRGPRAVQPVRSLSVSRDHRLTGSERSLLWRPEGLELADDRCT